MRRLLHRPPFLESSGSCDSEASTSAIIAADPISGWAAGVTAHGKVASHLSHIISASKRALAYSFVRSGMGPEISVENSV